MIRYLKTVFASAMCMALVLFSFPAQAKPGRAEAVEELKLYGESHVRAALFFSICTIRLYTPPSLDSGHWLKGEHPLKLEVIYHRSIRAERLVQLAEESLREQFGEAVITQFEDYLSHIHAIYRDVSDGDVYALVFQPSHGLTLSLNGAYVINIPNDTFALSYLHIWLGDHSRALTIRRDLKRSR